MGFWQMITLSERPDGELTGRFAPNDRRFRFTILISTLARAHAALDTAQKQFDAELLSAERDGQEDLAAEAVRQLAERRTRG